MVVEQIISLQIGPRLVRMTYCEYPNGGRTLTALDEAPVILTVAEQSDRGPREGLERRANVAGWDFPTFRKRDANTTAEIL